MTLSLGDLLIAMKSRSRGRSGASLYLQIYPSTLESASRMEKIGRGLHPQLGVDQTELVGIQAGGLPRRQTIAPGVDIVRLGNGKPSGQCWSAPQTPAVATARVSPLPPSQRPRDRRPQRLGASALSGLEQEHRCAARLQPARVGDRNRDDARRQAASGPLHRRAPHRPLRRRVGRQHHDRRLVRGHLRHRDPDSPAQRARGSSSPDAGPRAVGHPRVRSSLRPHWTSLRRSQHSRDP